MIETLIIIRGQARTWNWIKDRTLASLDTVAGKSSHWLWISPQTHTVTPASLAEDFGARAHSIIWVPTAESYSRDSYTSLAHYDLQAVSLILKLAPQHVVFTRQDLLLYPNSDSSCRDILEPREIRGWYPALCDGRPVTSDFYCRAGGLAGLILAQRGLEQDSAPVTTDASQRLGEYILAKELYAKPHRPLNRDKNLGSLASYIARPDNLEQAFRDWGQVPVVRNSEPTWSQLLPDQQVALCRSRGIDPRDYGHQFPE
jgi:hypothetical protein